MGNKEVRQLLIKWAKQLLHSTFNSTKEFAKYMIVRILALVLACIFFAFFSNYWPFIIGAIIIIYVAGVLLSPSKKTEDKQ